MICNLGDPMTIHPTSGWSRLIGSSKLQIIFHKRATEYRSLLQKWPMKIRDPMSLRHPVPMYLEIIFTKDPRQISMVRGLRINTQNTHSHTQKDTHWRTLSLIRAPHPPTLSLSLSASVLFPEDSGRRHASDGQVEFFFFEIFQNSPLARYSICCVVWIRADFCEIVKRYEEQTWRDLDKPLLNCYWEVFVCLFLCVYIYE